MTEDTYTIEQIRDAVSKALRDPQKTVPLIDYILRELQRPRYEFREGEVALFRPSDDRDWSAVIIGAPMYTPLEGLVKSGEVRPLRLSEMPKAVSDLRKAAVFCSQDWGDAHKLKRLREALATFDEVIHE